MNRQIFIFCGASGTGKTSLLNYITKTYKGVRCKELSARPYLPKNDSYDKTLTDELQAIIVQHRTLSILEDLLKDHQNHLIYSRGPIDNLAYQRVLNKGLFLKDCSIREIEILKNYATFLYLPIEFEMNDKEDTIRGVNKEVQINTDKAILEIFEEFSIPFISLQGFGSFTKRTNKIDLLFNRYKIKRLIPSLNLNQLICIGRKYKHLTIKEIIDSDIDYITECISNQLLELTNEAFIYYKEKLEENELL